MKFWKNFFTHRSAQEKLIDRYAKKGKSGFYVIPSIESSIHAHKGKKAKPANMKR